MVKWLLYIGDWVIIGLQMITSFWYKTFICNAELWFNDHADSNLQDLFQNKDVFIQENDRDLSVREITKSSNTFSATNISSNIIWLLQLHDTIQTKSQFGTKFSSIYLAKWEKKFNFFTIIC